jgi:hypothetical protein
VALSNRADPHGIESTRLGSRRGLAIAPRPARAPFPPGRRGPGPRGRLRGMFQTIAIHDLVAAA